MHYNYKKMSFENPFQNIPPEKTEREPEIEPIKIIKNGVANKLGGWMRRSVALAGAIGIGYFGGMQEGVSGDIPQKVEDKGAPKYHETVDVNKEGIKPSDSFDVLHKDATSTWGVEYVKKSDNDGRNFLAERYVKIDNATGKTTILGEYDNVLQSAEGISKLDGIPEQIKKYASRAASAVKTERAFQASGFTAPTGVEKVKGKVHLEKRNFEGYGVKAQNTVEVDEDGNVVRLIDSE
jgi:hypothetical protein